LKRSKYCACSKSCICVKLWTTRPVTTTNLHAEPEYVAHHLAANSIVFCRQYITMLVGGSGGFKPFD
jgi:hypothetical protein